MPHPSVKLQQESLGFLLADVSRLMRRAYQQRIQDSSLTLAQARALIYVHRNEGIRQVALAEILEVQPITLARLIDQLESAGLVERRADPGDRRAYHLYLRPAANAQLAAIEKVAGEIRADALRGLSQSEADRVIAALRKMHRNLSAR